LVRNISSRTSLISSQCLPTTLVSTLPYQPVMFRNHHTTPGARTARTLITARVYGPLASGGARHLHCGQFGRGKQQLGIMFLEQKLQPNDRLYSVTAILLDLQLPSFDTPLYNYKFSFNMQLTCGGNDVVRYLVGIEL